MKYGSTQDFLNIPVLHFRSEVTATAPTSPQTGQQWTDTSVTPAQLRYWDGTKWVSSNGQSIPNGYITDVMVSPTAAIALSKLAVDPLNRTNHTGTQLASTISNFDTQVRTSRLDQFLAPTTSVDFNGQRITNLGNPVGNADAVTKAYVDNARAGLSVKDPVRVAATGTINLASPGTAIDGITLVTGDRFLAPLQNTATENGIYQFNGPTTAATRTADSDGTGEVFDGSMVAVADGSHAGYQYIQTASASGTPGTWTQTWVVFQTGGQTYIAGNGLTLSGTTFALDAPVSIANGGTGAATALAARTNLGATTKYAADCGAMTAGVSYTITHNLNTLDVQVALRTTADGRAIQIDWAPVSVNTAVLYPDLSFSSGAIRAVVVG
jgi:hypothetical protein